VVSLGVRCGANREMQWEQHLDVSEPWQLQIRGPSHSWLIHAHVLTSPLTSFIANFRPYGAAEEGGSRSGFAAQGRRITLRRCRELATYPCALSPDRLREPCGSFYDPRTGAAIARQCSQHTNPHASPPCHRRTDARPPRSPLCPCCWRQEPGRAATPAKPPRLERIEGFPLGRRQGNLGVGIMRALLQPFYTTGGLETASHETAAIEEAEAALRRSRRRPLDGSGCYIPDDGQRPDRTFPAASASRICTRAVNSIMTRLPSAARYRRRGPTSPRTRPGAARGLIAAAGAA
jgi:hypothetical protein